jgi:hypothetical protein
MEGLWGMGEKGLVTQEERAWHPWDAILAHTKAFSQFNQVVASVHTKRAFLKHN